MKADQSSCSMTEAGKLMDVAQLDLELVAGNALPHQVRDLHALGVLARCFDRDARPATWACG